MRLLKYITKMSLYRCSCSLFASSSCSWWTWPFSCLTECFNNSVSLVKAPTFICSRCNWETCNNTFAEINHVDKYGSGILRFATGWFKPIRIKLKPIVTRDLLAHVFTCLHLTKITWFDSRDWFMVGFISPLGDWLKNLKAPELTNEQDLKGDVTRDDSQRRF